MTATAHSHPLPDPPLRTTTSLAAWPGGATERRMALGAILLSLTCLALAAPFAKLPLQQVWAFMPIYESALVLTDLITALLLFGQFRIAGSKAVLVLAGGYLFTALATIAHALSFPGLFAPGGLLGAGPQSTAWIYMFWHGGFPLFVVAYALLRSGPRWAETPQRASGGAIAAAGVGVAVAVAGLTWLATDGSRALPPIMQGNHYTPAMAGVVSTVWLASLLALGLLWRKRPHSVLDLWLMVVLCAWLCDMALSAMLNAGRFDLGFYVGRIYGLLAASLVLGALLRENGLLHARLMQAHAHEQRRVADLQRLSEQLELLNTQLADSNHLLQEQTRFKTEFLANMSHELRTPLNAVIGFAEMLKDGFVASPQKQRDFAQMIFDSGHHLLALINDILDLSKIEAGKAEVSLEPLDMDDVLRGALSLLASQAEAKHVQLVLECEAPLGMVRADRRRLKQILLNLMSNAMKFTPQQGQVTLRAGVVDRTRAQTALPGFANGVRMPLPDGPHARFIELSVSDTGIGIAPHHMRQLFAPFTQIPNALTRDSEGTGLGLVMVHRLADLHGGCVAVTSEPGRGSCFTVWLPWRESAEGQHPARATHTAQQEFSGNMSSLP